MQLGWVEELGSGVLNVSKYWQLYGTASSPQFIEGATFKIILPVSDRFFSGIQHGNQDALSKAINWLINREGIDGASDCVSDGANDGVSDGVSGGVNGGVNSFARERIQAIVLIVLSDEGLNALGIAKKQNHSIRTTERYLKMAKEFFILEFRGEPKTGGFFLTKLLMDYLKNNGA